MFEYFYKFNAKFYENRSGLLVFYYSSRELLKLCNLLKP